MLHRILYNRLTRIISIMLFIAGIGLIMVYPYAFKNVVGTSKHGFISLLMLGGCMAIIHGFGYIPVNKFWRILTAPYSAWTMIFLAFYFMFR